jgi:hypothetical protein
MREIVKRKDFIRLLSPVMMDVTRPVRGPSTIRTLHARKHRERAERTLLVFQRRSTLDVDEGPPKLDQGLLLSNFNQLLSSS